MWGIKFPQRVLGVNDDGIVGPKTLAAINGYENQEELFNKLWNRRKKHFQDIAKGGKAKFLGGWLNRLNDFKYMLYKKDEEIQRLSKQLAKIDDSKRNIFLSLNNEILNFKEKINQKTKKKNGLIFIVSE